MKCDNCGNQYAARVVISYKNDTKQENCDSCGASSVWLPDVYLEPGGGIRTNENLCDDKGTPIPYSTKREKASIMKMLKVREAGDKHHGARNETKKRTYFT